MFRLLLLLIALPAIGAESINVRVTGTTVENSPVALELKAGSNILDALALAGGMAMSSSYQVHVARKGESYLVDTIGTLRTPDAAFRLEDGDTLMIPEHMMGTLPWEAYNALLFEYGLRRSHGLPLTERWRRNASALYARTHKA